VSVLPDPRDEAFLRYWNNEVIDPTDPAASTWIDHCSNRVVQSRELVQRIRRHLDLKGCRALDVGCQTGALGIALSEAGARVTGIDVVDWLVKAGRMRSAGWGVAQQWVVGQSERLPFGSTSFDLVTFVDVIEHVQDTNRCLAELVRMLKPGGILYLQGPNRFSPQWFFSDPHYELFGASVLPPALGRRYVEWRRGRKGYDVGSFPIGHRVVSLLRKLGCTIIESPVQTVLARSHVIPLRRMLRWGWGHVRLGIGAIFTIVAQRA
jgi:ubiquinone/menaquinone biosynthesis C-methylase UbiE